MVYPGVFVFLKSLSMHWPYAVSPALVSFSAFLIHYVYVIDEVFEANTLRRHNDALVAELGSLKEDVSNMETTLLGLNQLDEKLRSMTSLAEDIGGMAVGPLASQKGAGGPARQSGFATELPLSNDAAMYQLSTALMESRVEGLSQQAEQQLVSLTDLVSFLKHRKKFWRIRLVFGLSAVG